MRFWLLILALCLGYGAWSTLPFPTAGVLAPGAPIQTMLAPGEVRQWNYRGAIFHPLARYTIKARILSRDSYYLDRASVISPLDLALGWDRMSDPHIYTALHVSQGGRWYQYYWSTNAPIPPDEIIRSSANTHIILATSALGWKLFWMREGDVVSLSGYLVQVQFSDGGTWVSSLSRTDTGDHSCEIMWVSSAEDVGR